MDLLTYLLSGIWNFSIASIPLINVFFLKRVCKTKEKNIVVILILQFLLSIYFWIKMEELHIFLYQIFPYVFAFIWVLCDLYLKRKKTQNIDTGEDDSKQLKKSDF